MRKVWTLLQLALALALIGLGTLWFLQGTGLLVIAPILCVGECEPLQGPSLTWSLIGLATLSAGGLMLARRFRRRG